MNKGRNIVKMININCTWKHSSLEYQIKKLDPAMTMSRSDVFSREILSAEKDVNWREIQTLLSRIERINEAPVFSNFQAKYDEKSAAILERIKSEICNDLELKTLQNRYLLLLLQVNYLKKLRESTLKLNTNAQGEYEDIDIPDIAKILMEMILLDRESESLKKIKDILIEWRNSR